MRIRGISVVAVGSLLAELGVPAAPAVGESPVASVPGETGEDLAGCGEAWPASEFAGETPWAVEGCPPPATRVVGGRP